MLANINKVLTGQTYLVKMGDIDQVLCLRVECLCAEGEILKRARQKRTITYYIRLYGFNVNNGTPVTGNPELVVNSCSFIFDAFRLQ